MGRELQCQLTLDEMRAVDAKPSLRFQLETMLAVTAEAAQRMSDRGGRMKKIIRNLADEAGRNFWAAAQRSAEGVSTWPDWRKAGITAEQPGVNIDYEIRNGRRHQQQPTTDEEGRRGE